MPDEALPRYLASEGSSHYYDGDYDALRTPSGDVEFYASLAAQSGGPVLEVGCGTGRVLVPTARHVPVDGVEPEGSRLNILLNKLAWEAEEVRERVLVYQADILLWQPERSYQLITMPFRVLQHFVERPHQELLLGRLREMLAPDGRLAFDVFAPDLARLAQGRIETIDVDRFDETIGKHVVRRSSVEYDLAEQLMDVTFLWSEYNAAGRNTGGAVWRFPLRYFFRFELELLLEKCGFEVEALYGGFDGRPFDYVSGETIVIARPA